MSRGHFVNVLDLFSGIGGFSLGLKRAGMRTVAFCEIDPYCRAVLRRHWPDVPVYDDVCELTVDQGWLVSNTDKRHEPAEEQLCAGRQRIRADAIDVICDGFPCQDISVAGTNAGITGTRSGLWSEYARIIGEVRPRYVIVENVAALLGRGLATVLGDLDALGFDAEWHCIPASAVGAPHRRDRVWIVAHVDCWGQRERSQRNGDAVQSRQQEASGAERQRVGASGQSGDVVAADQPLPQGWLGAELQQRAGEFAAGQGRSQWDEQRWFAQSGMGRVAHGVPARVDRLRALGNAVVPQIPEIIGRAIMSAQPVEQRRRERDG